MKIKLVGGPFGDKGYEVETSAGIKGYTVPVFGGPDLVYKRQGKTRIFRCVSPWPQKQSKI